MLTNGHLGIEVTCSPVLRERYGLRKNLLADYTCTGCDEAISMEAAIEKTV